LRPATATPNAPAALIPARAPRRRLVNAINPPDRPDPYLRPTAGRREECWNHFALPAQRRSGLGGLWDDAARTTRCGGACQAGEPRALAAAARRRAACPQTSAAGQADAIPTLIRRTLNCTKAPILSNLRRMEPQVALAKCV